MKASSPPGPHFSAICAPVPELGASGMAASRRTAPPTHANWQPRPRVAIRRPLYPGKTTDGAERMAIRRL